MGYPDTMQNVTGQIRREEIKSEREELTNHSMIDDVTDLYNERYFYLRLDEEMVRAKLYGNNLSLIRLERASFKKNMPIPA
jgi:PleD family two-component response regulator